MSKKELLGALTNAKNNYIFVFASITLFSNPTYCNPPLNVKIPVGSDETFFIEFNQVFNLLKDPNDEKIVINEFAKMGLRALLKESFELIKDYAYDTRQFQVLKNQNWFHFSRIIRNCLSHNFKFEFKKFNEKNLPVSWNNITIDETMDETYLKLDLFSYDKSYELFLEMNSFVENDLK